MTIKESILLYLEEKNTWIHSGDLERTIGMMLSKKDSNISRRCRELFNEGRLEHQYVSTKDGHKTVQYRVKPRSIFPSSIVAKQLQDKQLQLI